MSFRPLRHVTLVQFLIFSIIFSLILLDICFHLEPIFTSTFRLNENDDDLTLEESAEDVSESMLLHPKSRPRGPKNKESREKFRHIVWHDMPPERKSDWIKVYPETPIPRFPKCLLVGFSKCGTSALLSLLNFHPDIVSLDWETDYFCDRVYFKYSLHWYRMRMPESTSSQITIEKSPCYISELQALERILAFNSSIKVMVILRNPLTRIVSQHGQYLASFKTFGQKQQSLEDRYINKETGQLQENHVKKWGVYSSRMQNLLTVFPKNQIHIVDGDKFISDPLPVLSSIEKFLGIQAYFSPEDVYWDQAKGFYCPRRRGSNQTECMGHQKGRRHVEMSSGLRSKLKNYLRPYNQELFDIIGHEMDWSLD